MRSAIPLDCGLWGDEDVIFTPMRSKLFRRAKNPLFYQDEAASRDHCSFCEYIEKVGTVYTNFRVAHKEVRTYKSFRYSSQGKKISSPHECWCLYHTTYVSMDGDVL